MKAETRSKRYEGTRVRLIRLSWLIERGFILKLKLYWTWLRAPRYSRTFALNFLLIPICSNLFLENSRTCCIQTDVLNLSFNAEFYSDLASDPFIASTIASSALWSIFQFNKLCSYEIMRLISYILLFRTHRFRNFILCISRKNVTLSTCIYATVCVVSATKANSTGCFYPPFKLGIASRTALFVHEVR